MLTRGITYGTSFPEITNLPERPYGVNVELDKIVDIGDLRRSLAMIKEAGFDYIRQVFPWNEIEISAKGDFFDHKNGKSAWDKYDRLVDEANAAGLQVIARLERPPNWSRRVNKYPTRPPDNFQDYGDFVYAFVSHFRGRIHYIQIWNEPNRYEDWGYQPVDPVAYTRLLKIGYAAAKRADPGIVVLSAALTPTTDCCTKNRPDPVYLQQMYDAGAKGNFDVLGAQAYGLRAGPEDPASNFPLHLLAAKRAIIASQNTNFGRVVLDRDVMVRNGDAGKPVWVSEFGWNALPSGWSGDPSPWGSVSQQQQAAYTVEAYQRAQLEWPWLGVMNLWLFQDPSPAANDPTQFFGLVDQGFHPRPVYQAVSALTHQPPSAKSGIHRAGDAAAAYQGLWQPAGQGYVSPVSGARVTFRFEGQAVALQAVRGPAMGIAYVSIDGSPTYATDVAKDSAGRAAIDLYAPAETAATLRVASGLPLGSHELTLTVSGLHDPQSSGPAVRVDGFSVGLTHDQRWTYSGVGFAGLGLLVLGWNLLAALGRGTAAAGAGHIPSSLPRTVGQKLGRGRTGVLELLAARHSVLGTWQSGLQISDLQLEAILAACLALFYFASPLPLAAVGALAFLGLAVWRVDAALPLVALCAPFYLQPKHVLSAELPPSEVAIGICVAAYLLRSAWQHDWRWPRSHFSWPAVLFFLAATTSIGAAVFPRFALREYRTDVIEPLAFAALVILVRPRPKLMLDSLLAGGLIAALVGFAQYASGQGVHAEGVVRMVGIYRSPDNLGLYLGRMVPIAAAFALLLPASRSRRTVYGLATIVMVGAIALTFTRGAWLGAFAGLLAVGALAGRRWLALVLTFGAASAGGASLIQAKRIRSLLEFAPGTTGFSRLALWQATLSMIRDHPVFGVGLDNFLYQYPRYILPLARSEPDLSHPHNLILDFWSRIGIFGLASLVWLEVVFFRSALRLARLDDAAVRCMAVGLTGSMVDALVHGLVDNSYFLPDLSLVFWLSFALLQVLEWLSPKPEVTAA